VDHPLELHEATVRPWRTATLVAASVAAVELVLLLVVGGALLAKPDEPGSKAAPAAKAPAVQKTKAAATRPKAAPKTAMVAAAAKPKLARRQVSVVVLNGNGQQGAAAAFADRVSRRGYRIGAVANAPSHDYAKSMVMYRTGYAAEAQRLARDVGVTLVGPLDGIRAGQLHGAHTVLILGG
jgi:hypothetical protein